MVIASDIAQLPKRIAVLGATGSIGKSALDIVRRHPKSFKVVALTANKNSEALAVLANEFKPDFVAIGDKASYQDLKTRLDGTGVKCRAGATSISEAASGEADFIVHGIVGAAGLPSAIAAVQAGKVLALANKEALVCGGQLLLDEAERNGATILPMDSEHNAIFQILERSGTEGIDRITLTASGGPLLDRPLAELEKVTPAEALAHPNWDMGEKISIDSATMMNKGLELIEAFHLFPVAADQIDVVVHRQSVIHGFVSYVDGTVLAHMGSHDMRIPIAHTMAWPDRISSGAAPLDLMKVRNLTFEFLDPVRFPALELARNALEAGGSTPTILNAANEVAVAAFLSRKLAFPGIVRLVEQIVSAMAAVPINCFEDIKEIDLEARRRSGDLLVEGVI